MRSFPPRNCTKVFAYAHPSFKNPDIRITLLLTFLWPSQLRQALLVAVVIIKSHSVALARQDTLLDNLHLPKKLLSKL